MHDDPPTERIERPAFQEGEATTVIRHEEEVEFGKVTRTAGTVRARKHVDVDVVAETLPVDVEYVEMERAEASPDDDGETRVLPDGSVSIAVLEERVVIRTETVVAERVTLRKVTRVEDRSVEAEVRRERVEIDDSEVPGRVLDTTGRGGPA